MGVPWIWPSCLDPVGSLTKPLETEVLENREQSKLNPIDLQTISAAAEALDGIVTRTPLLENPDVNKILGGRLLVKAESIQRTGAFKFRGAYNCVRQLTKSERANGVITYSSGNHGRGLALAAKLLGSSALIVMPDDAPPDKVTATEALGAEITTFNRDRENSDDVVKRLASETGRTVVPPSADWRVLAGSGSVGLELVQQAEKLRASLDAVLVPCGGGGLTATTALVMQALSPATRVFSVEPELFDDMRRSLKAGQRKRNPPGQRTICDAIMTPTPTALSFPINVELLAGGLVASDEEVCAAMVFAYQHFKIVVEPGAMVGLAAILGGKIDIKGKTVATIVTGGNIDPHRFCTLLKTNSPRD